MADISFGTLKDVVPREAWKHEALNFTPWLAQNLDRIGEVIGRKLELLTMESSLPTMDDAFSADILARDLADDSRVLIENQLERSDHVHLGQILTYLAGLEAKTVVWVAPQFREAHLSAIRWLNDNTKDGISFFALKLRVVRIGESPFAPLFEVLARPNGFERQLKERKTAAEAATDNFNLDFWSFYLDQYPDDAQLGVTVRRSNNQWLPVAGNVVVGIWIAHECGVYVRGRPSVPIGQVIEQLEPYREQLESSTGAVFRENGAQWLLVRGSGIKIADRASWSDATDWIHRHIKVHLEAVRQVVASEARTSTPESLAHTAGNDPLF